MSMSFDFLQILTLLVMNRNRVLQKYPFKLKCDEKLIKKVAYNVNEEQVSFLQETWELQQIASLSCVLVIIYELNNEKMNKAFWMNIENMQSEGLIEEKRTKIKLYFHSTF
ncbi:unnamed protein product [Rhizophagus irregularis]|nr:unnamed protein product [Rhizophagus irregularis]